MVQLTDEIDGDSPVAEAAIGVAKEGLAVRRLVIEHRHIRSSQDKQVAGVDLGVAEGKQGGELNPVGAHAVETEEGEKGEYEGKLHGCKNVDC